jgi:plastocyanin
MSLRSIVAVAAVALVLACEHSPAAPTGDRATALSPSGAPAIAANTGSRTPAAAQSRQDVLVNIQDACDPDTFNAALGAGTCVRSGGMQFDRFIEQLTRLRFVGPWHFAPPNANVQVGQTFVALNKGGEVHTFTEVADFGGGIVPRLNDLAGVPAVAPECAALEPDDFVAPGTTYREDVEHAGTLKFQCCIHPWMRLEAKASSR